jgi:ATP-binding cassette subfamily B protein
MQKHIILLLWQTAMQYPIRTWVALVGSFTTTVIGSFYGPYIISLVLNQLQTGTITLDGSMSLIIIYSLTQIYGQIVGWRINILCSWTMETAGQRDLYQRIFSHLAAQSLNFHSDRFGGALVSQTTKLTASFERFWDTIIFQVVPTLASIIAATVILSFIFWQYAVFLVVLSCVFIVSVVIGSRFLATRNREESQASTATNGFIADAITNIMTIKSHGYEAKELDRLNSKTAHWRTKALGTMRGFLAVSTGYSVLITILYVAALVGAVWASEHAIVSLGTVYLSITYTFVLGRQLWEINGIMRSYNRIMGDAHDMTEILLLEPTVVDTTKQGLAITNGVIDFTHLSFSHTGTKEYLFNDFSLHVAHGERIGLVGRSGSGKTTLTKLLLRFADLGAGAITIDNQDISKITQASLRDSIAYVPQEPMLFHRSLRENIAYAKPDASDAEIRIAAKRAHALEFIDKLPEGLDTMVGERGVKLSGGQRQRIAIARAILKDAPILVLDEATSALDSESEKLIQDALEKLMKGRTSIIIAHRLSTIAKLDRIIVLEEGAIIEEGSHAALLSKKGTYATLWSHQSGGFIEEDDNA